MAGLAYGTLAATESIDLLGAPDRSSPVAEVARYYVDNPSLAAFTAVAGVLGLVAYWVFAVGLWRWLRASGGGQDGWATLGLVGGLAGPALAAVGQIGQLTLIARGSALTPGETSGPFDLYLTTRIVALVFIAATIIGFTTSGARAGLFPRWVWVPAWVLGLYALLMSLVAFTDVHGLQRAVLVAFVGHTAWVLIVSGWLLLPRWAEPGRDPAAIVAARVMFGAVVLAAGITGLALVAFPASTGRFFSWGLNPPPLAALLGGFYLGSAFVFALALAASWHDVRGMVAAVAVLAAPVFVVSVAHRDVFDFDKLQAWLWVVFFALFPLGAVAILLAQRHASVDGTPSSATPLPGWARAATAIVAAALLTLSVVLLVDPAGASSWWPFALPPLGGRVIACWFLFLAFLAGWTAWLGGEEDVRLPLVTLVGLSVGALIGALRTWSQVSPAGARLVYVLVAVLLVAVGGLLLARSPRPARVAGRHV